MKFFVEPGKVQAYQLTCACENAKSVIFHSVNDAYTLQENCPELRFDGCTNPDVCQNGLVDVVTETDGTSEVNVNYFDGCDMLNIVGNVYGQTTGETGNFESTHLIDALNSVLAQDEVEFETEFRNLLKVAHEAKNLNNRMVVWY